MWRTFLSGLNAVAMIHVIAFIAFVGWLAGSGRLDLERFKAIGHMLELLPDSGEQAMLASVAAPANPSAEASEAEALPAPPSAFQVKELERRQQRDIEWSQRITEEAAVLRRQLLDAQADLAAERAAFEEERSLWQAQREQTSKADSDAQFRRVVKLLEDMPARQSKDYLVHLVRTGGLDEAVRYLNAMKPFSASEVLRLFRPEEQQMAADLLQGMTSLGEASGASDTDPRAVAQAEGGD